MNRLQRRLSRHLSYPEWKKSWESFAGRPYVKAKNLDKHVIRDTVRDAQELLARMNDHLFCDQLRSARDYWQRLCVPPIQYPQSLGELCLGVIEEVMLTGTIEHPAKPGERFDRITWDMDCDYFGLSVKDMTVTRRDIQRLRETLYHKHREPEPTLDKDSYIYLDLSPTSKPLPKEK